MRLLLLLLWTGGVCALAGGFGAIAADVPAWPFVWAAAGLGASAYLLELAGKLVGR